MFLHILVPLLAPGILSLVSLTYGEADNLVRDELRRVYGFADIGVTSTHTPTTWTYTVTFFGNHACVS